MYLIMTKDPNGTKTNILVGGSNFGQSTIDVLNSKEGWSAAMAQINKETEFLVDSFRSDAERDRALEILSEYAP